MDKTKKHAQAQETQEPAPAEAAETKETKDTAETQNAEAKNPCGAETESGSESELEKAQALAEDYKRKWYAVTAEYENYRRRTANQSAQRYKEGRADVVLGLLPIADNLGRALESCRDEGTRKGIELVIKTFDKFLEKENISVIDPLGKPFDAEKHEAIMAVDPEEGEVSGTVKQVYLKGYEQDGRVIRFAQVVVIR